MSYYHDGTRGENEPLRPDFKPGDLVRLQSGGPLMTVRCVRAWMKHEKQDGKIIKHVDQWCVECIWFKPEPAGKHDDYMYEESFDPACIVLAGEMKP